MALGGARPGAGRKPKAVKYHRDIVKAEKQIRDALPEIVDTLIKVGLGEIHAEKSTDMGMIVYKIPPDPKTLQYLVDRIAGKPTQKEEITGENGNELVIKVVRDRNPFKSIELPSGTGESS